MEIIYLKTVMGLDDKFGRMHLKNKTLSRRNIKYLITLFQKKKRERRGVQAEKTSVRTRHSNYRNTIKKINWE